MKCRLSFEESRRAVYNHDIMRKDLPIGMTLSYPVFRREKNGVVISFFLYSNAPGISRDKGINPPSAWLFINAINGKLCFFSRRDTFDFVGETDQAPEGKVEGLKEDITLEELKKIQGVMAEKFNNIKDYVFEDKSLLDNRIREEMKAYLEMFNRAVPEGHKIYYRKLAGDFFSWLEE